MSIRLKLNGQLSGVGKKAGGVILSEMESGCGSGNGNAREEEEGSEPHSLEFLKYPLLCSS